jgi:hypothetical protein
VVFVDIGAQNQHAVKGTFFNTKHVGLVTYGNPRQAKAVKVLLSYELHDERDRCHTYLQ